MSTQENVSCAASRLLPQRPGSAADDGDPDAADAADAGEEGMDDEGVGAATTLPTTAATSNPVRGAGIIERSTGGDGTG